MSERGSFRGGRGRGGGYDRSRGGHAKSGGAGGGAQQQQEKPKKENILDLTKYMDKEVRVKFNGGREGMFIFLSFFLSSGSFFPCHFPDQVY
jgi:U6 snRNA-associated Sm-like protein LSm7